MPEMSLLAKAVLFGFIALLVLVIAAYHAVLDPRRPTGGQAETRAGETRCRSTKAA